MLYSISYVVMLLLISSLFSIRLCGKIDSFTSWNFECGFYSLFTSSVRYRLNYWLIIIHFLIFEQELILAVLLIFGCPSFNYFLKVFLLLVLLFIDLLLFVWGFSLRNSFNNSLFYSLLSMVIFQKKSNKLFVLQV